MNVHDNNANGSRSVPFQIDEPPNPIGAQAPPVPGSNEHEANDKVETPRPGNIATRAGINAAPGIGKNKLILLGGGLAVAVLFFVFTAIVGKSPKKQTTAKPNGPQASLSGSKQAKGSVTPVMEAVHTPSPDNSGGQLGPGDIRRTRSSDGKVATATSSQFSQKPASAASLGGVPSFADTQQKWEEPQPYGEPASTPAVQTQQQNSLKEPSLIFVRAQVQSQSSTTPRLNTDDDEAPVLEMTPGMRIQAKLETQISSAVQEPVVAVVEYTYAIGDRIVVPAGARIYGKLVQADRSGLVNVEFAEIRLLDGNRDEKREKIDAIGLGLDLGPIKGMVSGKNTGKNFLVRAASGMGSVLAEIAGNKSSAAFSEDDMLRERLAENMGTAGDSEVMNLNANSRIVVTVPADTKIYVVFTKHQEKNSAERRKVSPATP
jgi:hypothetical protein